MNSTAPLRVGVGGPVGSGKTALLEVLCKALRDRYEIAVVTNDIYTQEDAQILMRAEALPFERIVGVETGGCPHTAIRDDIASNLDAVEQLLGDLAAVDSRQTPADCQADSRAAGADPFPNHPLQLPKLRLEAIENAVKSVHQDLLTHLRKHRS